MSDVRVPIDKETDSAKRRSGASGFSEMLAHGGSSPNAGANPYSLMADFIDDAFDDCKLDHNEVEGMKVLAGYTPCAAKPAPPAETPCPPKAEHPQPPPAAAPCPPREQQPPCPTEALSPKDFMQEVGKKAVQSKGCSSAEGKMIDLATRLMHANLNQQQAFLGRIDDYIASGSEIDEAESFRLSAFVDGLLEPSHQEKKPAPRGDDERMVHMQQGTTTQERIETRIGSWVTRGSIAPEVAAAAKRIQRAG